MLSDHALKSHAAQPILRSLTVIEGASLEGKMRHWPFEYERLPQNAAPAFLVCLRRTR